MQIVYLLTVGQGRSNASTRPKRKPKYKKKSCVTKVASQSSSEVGNLYTYYNDETLGIKQEMIEIGYENRETVDIKDEITQDLETEEVTGRSLNTRYETKVCTVYIREGILSDNVKQPIQKKQQVPDSKSENKFKCKKCARSYKRVSHLNNHLKYECDVIPQFVCKLCDRRFKRNDQLNRHVRRVHLKSNLTISEATYNCDICSRSYKYLRGLTRHKREIHAGIKRQFTCDYCGHIASQKIHLGIHIYSHHFM
ncbi:zinc finger protein 865-like [Belonocnema kinseyi]|uniref:zinc finger protein 865-like n=1 Tax=Belonocnema kinseyi TaxID=2817044 RepID=UPI00143CE3EA|nr:zinc finger protein 865-like [Belonocnema kinseyi]